MLALVDDWGNPSPTGVGTEWFGFGGLFLKDSQVEPLRILYASICKRLGRRPDTPLHLRKLGLENKYHIIKSVAKTNLAVSIVAVRIHAVTSQKLQQRGWAYHYYAKEIIRSASHFAADCDELAKVVFHRHDYLEDIEDYIRDKLQYNYQYMRMPPSRRIDYMKLTDVHPAGDDEELLLGLADCIAHACHMALNPNPVWQQVNPVCLNLLADCIWQGPWYNKNARLFGIQLEPGGVPVSLISELPDAIRRYWEF